MLRMLFALLLLTTPALAADTAAVRFDDHAPAAATAAVRFAGIDGGEVALADYRGRPVLVANTASLCGFTPQYEGLQALWERYRAQGLVVIGVPTGDFGNQEFGDDAAIKEFCEVNFAIDFPLAAKATTRGPDQHPFFAAVVAELGRDALPRWNFHKFLVGADGRLRASWPAHVAPSSDAIVAAVEAELAAGG